MKRRQVILCAGHHPERRGCYDERNGWEHDIAVDIVDGATSALEEMAGLYDVFVATPYPLRRKVAEVNAYYANHAGNGERWLYVGVHVNSALRKESARRRGVNGHEVYSAFRRGRSWRAARAIEGALCDLRTRARGAKIARAHWLECFGVGPPAVLVEPAFVWEPMLGSGGGRRMLGGLIASGVNSYFEAESRR